MTNQFIGLKTGHGQLYEQYSYAGGRRTMCKSVGLKPTPTGCAKALNDAGWSKGSKDDAIDILCDAGILGGVDCTYFQAGGELQNEGGMNLGKILLWLGLLLALIIGGGILVRKYRKN